MHGSKRAKLILIIGVPQCGKTYLARKLASRWPRRRTWVYDPQAELGDLGYQINDVDRDDERQDLIIQPGNLLVVDELDTIAPNRGHIPWWVREVIRRGRHRQISMIATCLLPQDIHRSIRSLVSTVYLGKTTDRDALVHCARSWGPGCLEAHTLPLRQFREIIVRPTD